MDLEIMAGDTNRSAWRSGKWVKSSHSGGNNECVELRYLGVPEAGREPLCAIRDSMDPDGPVIEVDLRSMLTALKSGKLHP